MHTSIKELTLLEVEAVSGGAVPQIDMEAALKKKTQLKHYQGPHGGGAQYAETGFEVICWDEPG